MRCRPAEHFLRAQQPVGKRLVLGEIFLGRVLDIGRTVAIVLIGCHLGGKRASTQKELGIAIILLKSKKHLPFATVRAGDEVGPKHRWWIRHSLSLLVSYSNFFSHGRLRTEACIEQLMLYKMGLVRV